MRTVNIHEAKTHLSRLIKQASEGETIVIAKSGKPLVQVTPINTSKQKSPKRLGFMKGQITIPKDFDHLGHNEIEKMFHEDGD